MSLNFVKRKYILTDPKDIKELISLIDKYELKVAKIGNYTEIKSQNIFKERNKTDLNLSSYIIIELKDTKLEITTRYYEKYFKYATPCTYIFDLNNDDIFSANGLDCFREMSRAYKIPKAKDYKNARLDKWFDEETGKYICSAKPILSYNKKFENQPLVDCYEYDLNSAYAATLLEKLPDLTKPTFAEYPNLITVNKDEIGFMIDDDLTLVEPGYKADVKFPMIKTPKKFKEFLIRWYTKKKTTTGLDKLAAKAMLNLPIGYCQRVNPFFRSYVVNSCNKVIKKLINSETLFWNTDAIFCLKKRPELNIGPEIGQFKEIKCDKLAYIQNTYQVNDEFPTYRGINKNWFKAFEKKFGRKYNLLLDNDKTLERKNLYTFNWDTLQLERVDYEKEIK